MKHQNNSKKHHIRDIIAVWTGVLLFVVAVGGLAITQRVDAKQTAASYCSQYTTLDSLNACNDGIRGADCNDYAIIATQVEVEACNAAKQIKASGQIDETTTTTDTSEGSTEAQVYKNVILSACNSYETDATALNWCLYGGLGKDAKEGKPKTVKDCQNNAELKKSATNLGACISGALAGQAYLAAQNPTDNSKQAKEAQQKLNFMQIQDKTDQTTSLSDYTNLLHQNGQDSKVDISEKDDTSLDHYINGAGNEQKIVPINRGTGKSPAILFLNGGGWHANDQNGQRIMAGEGGAQSPAARGYAAYDVTYRLGSSGVYYMFEDVMRGINHMIKNADRYGIDPAKVVIWGDSSGGSLAMRAAASGKSGAKVAVGWSPPTNAYTGMFKSYKSFLIGVDHSTCIPTDLAGITNLTDALNGGSGDVAQYGTGLASNDFSNIGLVQDGNGFHFDSNSIGGAGIWGTLTQVLSAGQYAMQTSQNIESISSQVENGGLSSLSGSIMNLTAKKLSECIDNFNALSPALFASPETPPSFLAGFNTDDLVEPGQVTGMRDKLLSMGIKSAAMLLDGDPNGGFNPMGANKGNHLDYDMRFVCDTMNFVDSVIQPERGTTNCATGEVENAGSTGNTDSSGGGSTASSDSGGSSSGSSSSGSGSSNGGGGNGGSGANTTPASSSKQCGSLQGPYASEQARLEASLAACQGGSWKGVSNAAKASDCPSGTRGVSRTGLDGNGKVINLSAECQRWVPN